MAGPDTSDPTLTSTSLPQVNVSGGGATVTFSVGALDSGSGVDRVYLYFDHGWEGASGVDSVIALTDSADSFADGLSSTSVYFGPATAAGTYGITSAIVYDKAGNSTQYSAAELTALGIGSSFTVVSNMPADSTAPELTGASLPGVDVRGGGETVTFSAAALDSGSGVDQVIFYFDHSWAGQSGSSNAVVLAGGADDWSDGASSTSVYFGPQTAAGSYALTSAVVYDDAGNSTTYSPAQLASLGIATSFDVLSNTPADTTAPTLSSVTLPNVDVTAGGETALFSAAALDSGTGVDRVDFYFDHGWQGQAGLQSSIELSDAADSFADGLSSTAVYVDQSTAAGTYSLTSAIVYDKAGNSTAYSPSELAALGMATSFTVADHNVAPTALVSAPASLVEGRDASGQISLTLLDVAQWSGTVTMAFDAERSTAVNGVDVDVPSFTGTYSVTQAGSDFTIALPSLTVLGGSAHDGTQTIAVTIRASGQIFASGTDSETILIPLRDEPVAHNDFSGDGKSDFLLLDSNSGWLTDWTGTSTGALVNNGANASIHYSSDWHVVGTGDVNGDGRVDYILRSDAGWTTDWLGTPSGGFTNNGAHASILFASNWQMAGTGDFNGDGHTDFLLRDTTGGWLTEWLGNASGGFTNNGANSTEYFTSDWHVVGTGDFNGDGIDDFLLQNTAGWVTDWLGTSTGGFTNNGAHASLYFTSDWHVIGTGDFNGDGISDILLRSDAGWVSDWLGNSSGGFTNNGANASILFSSDWKIASIGDFNGDGHDDLLLRSDAGWTTDWLGTASGGFTNNGAHFSTYIAPEWHVQDPFL